MRTRRINLEVSAASRPHLRGNSPTLALQQRSYSDTDDEDNITLLVPSLF